MEEQSILASYINSSKTFSLIDFDTKSSKLPISYLKFLLFIDSQPQLTETQYMSLFEKAPLSTFEFIERYPIYQLNQIWLTVLNNLFMISFNEMDSQLFDSHLDIFYCFIQSSLMHLNLLSLVSKSFIHRIFKNVLFSNDSFNFSEHKWSVLLILLTFSRINNNVSQELADSIEFEKFLRKIVLNSVEKFESIKTYFFWVLNPTSSFPIDEIMPLHAKYVFDNLTYPSITFSKKIAPQLVSLLMIQAFSGSLNESDVNNFASQIIQMWKQSENKNLHYGILLGISNEEALKLLVPLAMTNSICYDLLCISLSFSCQFSAFSMIYNSIGEDHKKILQFLTVLAKKTPIVNDFVRLKKQIEIKTNCFEKTVVMWIRLLKENTTIASFYFGKDSSLVVMNQMNTFIFDINQKKISFIKSESNVEGWHFLCISFSKDYITACVNLKQIKIENNSNSHIVMSFGENQSIFDFQSVRIFHSILSENQIKYLFFLGPNIKRLIMDNLSCIKLKEKSYLYATNEGYLSSIFANWISHVKSIKSINYSNDFRLEYDISPPFISNDEFSMNNKLDLSNDRFHLQPFFNSFEAFGGFSLLIHIFSEIILKEKELHELVFELIFILLNRFPFVHHIFKKNKYYQIIGQLLKKTSKKVDFKLITKCTMISINEDIQDDSSLVIPNIIISNSNALKYWLLLPSIFYNDTYDIIEKIYESLQSKYEEYNLKIIFHSPIFAFISNSFLISKTNSYKLFELLISLRLKITTKENAKENINTIIQCLLEYHFSSKGNNKNKCDESNEESEIYFLTILNQILSKFPESKSNPSLQDLLPLFNFATVKVKSVIFEILMKYMNPKYYSDFIYALQYSKPDREFIEQVFHKTFKFFNISQNMETMNFHYITIPLLYFIHQIEIAEDFLISFCIASIQSLRSIPKYPEMMLVHFLKSFYLLTKEKPNMAEKHLEPKIEESFTRIPQILYMYITFVWVGVFKIYDQSYDLCKFLLDILLIDYGQYSVFILTSSIDNLKENLNKNNEIVCSFVDFCFKYLILVIHLRKEIFSTNDPPPYIQLFIISSIRIMNDLYEKFRIKNLTPQFMTMISEINSNYPDVYSSISDDLKECKFPLKKTKKTTSSISLHNSIEKLKEYLSNRKEFIKTIHSKDDEIDRKKKLDDFYNKKVAEKQESNEGLINSWKDIFDNLHFPGSLIHKDYPEKYKVNGFSKKYQIHRVLFPVNPAYEPIYLDEWSEKYLEQQPEIKLTMNDVINDVGISHSDDISFSEKVIFNYGVKPLKAHLSMNKTKLRFYLPSKHNEIIFKLKNISRIILNEYQHQPLGLSIEDKYDNLYSFAFESKIIRNDFYEKTKKVFAKKNIKIIKRYSITELNSKTREWENGNISNFEYLVNLNFISGRSWSDFTRYPIFPWVFSGLQTNKENEKAKEETETTKEEIETKNEEIETKNEEIETTKEEIETTKEEIETTKEEIETKNEENSSLINDRELEIDLSVEKIAAEKDIDIEKFASSPLPISNDSEEEQNHSIDSISSISKTEQSNSLIITRTESLDNSEIDISITSASEDTKLSSTSLFSSTFQAELKPIKSTPSPQVSSISSSPYLTPGISVPLAFFNHPFLLNSDSSNHSTEKASIFAHSASSYQSDSSYKLDLIQYQRHQSNKQQNEQPSFRIKSFDDIFSINSKSQYIIRNLCLPFYAQTSIQQDCCRKYYQLTKRVENDPHHYSSYLSNISSALYFLVRLEPSTTFEIDHQDGKLDAADRTFQSLELTLQVMSSPDSRSAIELIPELFFMPEIMMNINKINFPKSPIHERIINDVIIPKWAKDHFQYVRFLRKLLESEKTSCTLNTWIDIVWGNLRKGNLARDYFNTFQKIVFDFDPDQYSNNPKLLKAFETQIVNCGQAPFQIFGFLHPRRNFQPKKRKLAKIDVNVDLFDSTNLEILDQKLKIEDFSPLIDHNDVRFIVNKNNELVFAHKNVPVLSFWNIVRIDGPNSNSKSRVSLDFICLMRGNVAKVTALDFSDNRFFVAGHIDGKLSTFCYSSYIHFLRTIECPLNSSVSLVKVMNDNSSIIAFQNFLDQDNQIESCLISLFSINGMLIEKLKIDDHVIDCTLSSFFNGIQTNYAFVLTKKRTIYALSMNSLKIKNKIEMKDDLISIHLKDNSLLSVVTKFNKVISFRLF